MASKSNPRLSVKNNLGENENNIAFVSNRFKTITK